MLPREVEIVFEIEQVYQGTKRCEQFLGLDTALYKLKIYCKMFRYWTRILIDRKNKDHYCSRYRL